MSGPGLGLAARFSTNDMAKSEHIILEEKRIEAPAPLPDRARARFGVRRGFTVRAVVLLAAALLLAGCSVGRTGPQANDGRLDLSSWSFAEGGPVELDGEWAFYRNQLIEPGETDRPPTRMLEVPGYWHEAMGAGETERTSGYASYVLHVDLPAWTPQLALKIKDMATAYELFVNGLRVASNGVVGRTPETSAPEYDPRIVVLPPFDTTGLEIVMRISNYEYRTGGFWESISLGRVPDILGLRDQTIFIELLMAGAIAVMALYHLGVFWARREDPSALWFGLFCFAIVVRIFTTGERLITEFVPRIDWSVLVHLEYLSFLFAAMFFGAFLSAIYPEAVLRWALRALYGLGALGIAIVLVTPTRFFSSLLIWFQLYLVIAVAYGLYALYVAIRDRLSGSWIFLLGFLGIAVGVVNDIARSVWVLDTSPNLIGPGIFIFILAQAVLLSRRFSDAFDREEHLAGQLKDYTRTLEDRVQQRTVALEHANRQLESANEKLGEMATTDALTRVANRRRFDDLLYQEWARHRRRGASLALILCDIDFFKQFNDIYGHTDGDEALRAVAAAIRRSLRRETDVVARYGGEEFAILLPDTDAEGAVQIAEQIRNSVADLDIAHRGSGATEKLSASAGVAVMVPSGTRDPMALIDNADEALYQAKEGGRDRVVLASE